MKSRLKRELQTGCTWNKWDGLWSQQAADSCILLLTFLTENVSTSYLKIVYANNTNWVQPCSVLRCFFTTAGFNSYAFKLHFRHFFKHLLKPPWQAARNHELTFSEQLHEHTLCSPVRSTLKIRNLRTFNTAGVWPFNLAKKFTVGHMGQVKPSAVVSVAQLSLCSAITQPEDWAVTLSKLSQHFLLWSTCHHQVRSFSQDSFVATAWGNRTC